MNKPEDLKPHLDRLFNRFDKAYLSPDPLLAADGIADPDELETALLIAALFAYGRADLIQKNVSAILASMGGEPARFCDTFQAANQTGWQKGFSYRFNKRGDLVALVKAIARARAERGSIKNLFLAHDDPCSETILPGLTGMAQALRKYAGGRGDGVKYLLSDPAKGGACKRWNLYLRWMARKDRVDPGPWSGAIDPARLVIPLDTHVGRIARLLGMLERKSNDWKAAIELTGFLKKLDAYDPVKYDFAICSYGKLGYCVRQVDRALCASCDMEPICSKKA